MVDIGVTGGDGEKEYDDADYTLVYLSDLEPGEKLTGEVLITEIKDRKLGKKMIEEFYVIITNHKKEEKWVCGVSTSVYRDKGKEDDPKVYGSKGSRTYELIDSINNVLNNTEREERKSITVFFEKFRESVNDNIKEATFKTVPASNPNAKSPNFIMIGAVLREEGDDTGK